MGYYPASLSRLEPMRKFVKIVRKHRSAVIAGFLETGAGHRSSRRMLGAAMIPQARLYEKGKDVFWL